MKPEKDEPFRIECKETGPIEVKVDDVFYYGFHRHGSVGEDAEFEIGDKTIISHESTEAEYLHPERMKPGWTGGDAERCKWLFKALKPGTTTIIVRVLFRFEVESECTMQIKVV